MKLGRHLCFLPLFVIFSAVIACPQAGNPVTALEELVTTEKITDAVKHYPVAVEEAVQGLQENDQAEAAKVLLINQRLRGAGWELRKTSDPMRWEVVSATGDGRFTLTLLNSFISGINALIVMRIDFPTGNTYVKFASLRFEAGEWRLENLGSWQQEKDFESDEFIQELTPAGRNEKMAMATLGEIRSALAQYHNTYRSTGFPSSLAALSGPAPEAVNGTEPPPEAIDKPNVPESEEPDNGQEDSPVGEPIAPQYAHLLDPIFMNSPVVKDGYKFQYKLIDPGAMEKDGGEFQLTATPLQFGKTGSRSYFADQRWVLRFTTENRDANENDEPLDK
ncbi:MAG TPA: hypothetical protein VI685_02690 [Candidatus Angelobacter sp.]